jgi:hypothetical protein
MLVRWNGHCHRPYSVAEHCVLLASRAPDHLKLTALMHDASEAYLGDVPSPLKVQWPGYRDLEHRWMTVIAGIYGFEWPMPPEIKALDGAIRVDEMQQNMAPGTVLTTTASALGVTLQFWSPSEAFAQFIAAFNRYRTALRTMQRRELTAEFCFR